MSKGIYTQEMKDKCITPLVGMEVEYEDEVVTIVGLTTKGYLIFERPNGMVNWFNENSEYKPLTPPITLIDGERYEFELSFGDFRVGYYVEDRNSFFDGMLCSNKICGKGEASNIELLTVK